LTRDSAEFGRPGVVDLGSPVPIIAGANAGAGAGAGAGGGRGPLIPIDLGAGAGACVVGLDRGTVPIGPTQFFLFGTNINFLLLIIYRTQKQ